MENEAQKARNEVLAHMEQELAKRDWPIEAKFAMLGDTKLTTRQHAAMAIAEADEIYALCKVPGIAALCTKGHTAADFIAARKSLDSVRAYLLDLRAEQSEASHIDTSRPSASNGGAPSMWAIYRKQREASR